MGSIHCKSGLCTPHNSLVCTAFSCVFVLPFVKGETRILVLPFFSRVSDLRRQSLNLLVICDFQLGYPRLCTSSMRSISMDRVLARHNVSRWKCIVRVWSHTIPRSFDIAREGCVDCTRTECTGNRCREVRRSAENAGFPMQSCADGGAVR